MLLRGLGKRRDGLFRCHPDVHVDRVVLGRPLTAEVPGDLGALLFQREVNNSPLRSLPAEERLATGDGQR